MDSELYHSIYRFLFLIIPLCVLLPCAVVCLVIWYKTKSNNAILAYLRKVNLQEIRELHEAHAAMGNVGLIKKLLYERIYAGKGYTLKQKLLKCDCPVVNCAHVANFNEDIYLREFQVGDSTVEAFVEKSNFTNVNSVVILSAGEFNKLLCLHSLKGA